MDKKYSAAATSVAQSIRELASKPENLDNLECYLSMHFAAWLDKYAATPEDMAAELRDFAKMDI